MIRLTQAALSVSAFMRTVLVATTEAAVRTLLGVVRTRYSSVGSGQTSASTSLADITGTAISIPAGTSVSFVGEVQFEVSSASGGIGLAINGTTAAAYVSGRIEAVQGAGNFVVQITAYNSTTNAVTIPTLGVVYYARISGRIVNGGSTSSVTLQVARGGSGTLTIRSASLLLIGD